jgi:hypothetical protein
VLSGVQQRLRSHLSNGAGVNECGPAAAGRHHQFAALTDHRAVDLDQILVEDTTPAGTSTPPRSATSGAMIQPARIWLIGGLAGRRGFTRS